MTNAAGTGAIVVGRGASRGAGSVASRWVVVLIVAGAAIADAETGAGSPGVGPAPVGHGSASRGSLGSAGGAGSGSVGSGSVGSGSASRPVAAVSAAETDCSAASVKQFSDRAERAFNAGFPTAALALVSRALVCKPDDRLYRLAALYACAARDRASAQWSYDRLPAQARPAVAARCQQEKIALSEPSVASPARDPGADEVAVRPWTAAAPTIRPWCTASKVDDLVDQADKQFRAGAAALALSLYMSAIECRPDPMMYPLAAVYACVARDTDWAEEFYLRSQSIYQGAIRYRCQQEGISLRAPRGTSPPPAPKKP